MTMPGRSRFIVTTEKDAVRLANNPYFPHELKAITFYLPIKVDFMRQESDSFETAIRKLIRDKQSQTLAFKITWRDALSTDTPARHVTRHKQNITRNLPCSNKSNRQPTTYAPA